ncbi:MAG: DNRLRE domain-containing protein [Gemmatimonadota bacterium]
MTRSLFALAALWAAACAEDGGSPVGDDLLPGGPLGGDLEIVTVSEFALAEDVSIFPADRADADRLVMAHQWPDPNGFEARPLIRFSLAGADSFPDDSEILEASLELHFQAVEEPVDLAVHRVTAAWTEEAATWERRDLGVPWTLAGGDFDTVPLAEFTIPGRGEQDSAAVDSIGIPLPVDLVVGWLAEEAGNEGLVLVQETPGVRVELVSRGAGGVNANGPRLEFIVQLAAPGSPAAEVSILAREDTFLADGGEVPAGDLVVSGGTDVRRLVLVPDLESLPVGTVVARAQLVLPVEGVSLPGDSIAFVAGRVASEFLGDKTILAAPAGVDFYGLAPVVKDSLPIDSLVFEGPFLTRVVRAWVRSPETNRGLFVILVNETAEFGAVGFPGPDGAPERRPHLRLVILPPEGS